MIGQLIVASLFILSVANAESSVDEAYKRELQFLQSQVKSFRDLQNKLKQSFAEREKKGKESILLRAEEITKLQQDVQLLQEEVKWHEKMTKDLGQSQNQMEKSFAKFQERLTSTSIKLGVSLGGTKEAPLELKVLETLPRALKVLTTLQQDSWRPHAFLNENNQLVTGEVRFIGLTSALGKIDGKNYLLSPYNQDYLKVLRPQGKSEIYLFTPDFTKQKILAPKTWKETLADYFPGLVMLIILVAVLGLFGSLAAL